MLPAGQAVGMTDLKALAEIHAALGPSRALRLGPYESLVNYSITPDLIIVAVSTAKVRERRDGSYVIKEEGLTLHQWQRRAGAWEKTETMVQCWSIRQ